MTEAWRIVKAKHATAAFSGEGAAKTGGRWNSIGVAVVYTSSTKSLAALESLVHLNPPVIFKYVVIGTTFDDTLIEFVDFKALPSDWRVEPPSWSSKALGDFWIQNARSAVLAVPSVIVSEELNYLLNPAHPDFKRVLIGKPRKFTFDARLM